jgi:ribosomal protein S18 acetylase RimI-like enzyme
MAGYDGHRGWVNYLAVAPEHRSKGHGGSLMRRIEDLLAARGCPKLNVQVRADNLEALQFYRKIGYVADEAVSLGKRLIPD